MHLTIQSFSTHLEIVPAREALPEWFRSLAHEVPIPGSTSMGRTAKSCSPLTDAFTMGYMVLLKGEVKASHLDGKTKYEFESEWPLVSFHQPEQAPGMPEIAKWDVGSGLILPEGYSALHTHPLSRVELPFHSFSGVVDDGYNSPVLIPFVWTGREGRTTIPAGTPIAQIIPFKREDWTHDHIVVDGDTLRESTTRTFEVDRGYRKLYRKVKRYR